MESQAKTQVVFQAKTQAKNVSIELPPCFTVFRSGSNSGSNSGSEASSFFFFLLAMATAPAIPAPVGKALTAPGSIVRMGLGPIGMGLGIPMGGRSMVGFRFRSPAWDNLVVLLFG